MTGVQTCALPISSVRVPLFIRSPSRFAPRTVRENVSLCDLYATLCDLCGLDIPDNLDSRSLVPLMEGSASRWNNEAVSQYHGEYLMIKQDHLKYHYYGEDMPEVLWDLEEDPGETKNLIGHPRYQEAAAAMRRRRASLGFGPDADPNYKNAGYGKEATL